MLFAALPAEHREELRREATLQRFGEGALIQQRGEQAGGFWLIERGSVAIGQFLIHGEFRAAAVLGAGDSWGELAVFAGRPRVVDAMARSECEVAFIRASRFEELLAREPQLMRSLLGTLSAQLQEVLDLLAGIRQGTARPRIAGMLSTIASGREPPVVVAMTQQELAELLGLTRATVNAGLRDLEAAGCISRSYGKILVERPEQLRLLAVPD